MEDKNTSIPTDLAFYTTGQAAIRLQVHERTILDAIKDGNLTAWKLGKRWYIFHNDLEEFIKSQGKKNK